MVLLDHTFDLNTFLNKYKHDNISTESQPNLDKLNYKTIRPPNEQENKYTYTVLHLNIQCLYLPISII